MSWEQDYDNVYEAARVLEISPARVRQMLRAEKLQGERGERLVEGAPWPWRLPAGAVHAARSVANVDGAADTVVMPSEGAAATEGATATVSGGSSASGVHDPPSETSERLSEGVQNLREKAEALIAGLDALEGRLEAAEMQQLALKRELRRAEELSEEVWSELEGERARATGAGEPGGQRGSARRRWLGGR